MQSARHYPPGERRTKLQIKTVPRRYARLLLYSPAFKTKKGVQTKCVEERRSTKTSPRVSASTPPNVRPLRTTSRVRLTKQAKCIASESERNPIRIECLFASRARDEHSLRAASAFGGGEKSSQRNDLTTKEAFRDRLLLKTEKLCSVGE